MTVLEQYPIPQGLSLPEPRALLGLMDRIGIVGREWSRFARALVAQGSLPPQIRELAVIRIGWRLRCAYELAGHFPLASHFGVSPRRIASALGEMMPLGADATLFMAVDEMLTEKRLSRSTKGLLSGFLSEEQVIELIVLTGQYNLVGVLCESFGLEPETRRSP